MTTRTSKKQQARELAMQALAEKIAKQERVKEATQQAFLAQADFDGVRRRFASALQELDKLGESQSWMRASFDLTANELRSLLSLATDTDEDSHNAVDNDAGNQEQTTDEHHAQHQ